jgi:transcription-repair coupling factor (superfamily II helicase)
MERTTPPAAIGRLVAARALKELAQSVRAQPVTAASGLWGSSLAAVTAALQAELRRPVVVMCGHVDEVDDIADDMELFHGARPDVLPALELAAGLGRMSEEQAANRFEIVSRWASESSGAGSAALLVGSVQAFMQPVPSRQQMTELVRHLRAGQELDSQKLIVWLAEHGYNRLEQVEVPGDFAVRGGIVDIYLPGEFEQAGEQVGLTVRVDFFGDRIESIKQFDLDSLGSKGPLESVRLVDIRGQLPQIEQATHFFSYLPPDSIVVFWSPLEIAEQSRAYLDRLPAEVKGIYPLRAVLEHTARFARVELSQFGQGTATDHTLTGAAQARRLPVGSLQKFETDAAKAVGELAELVQTHDVTVFCGNAGEMARFGELLDQRDPALRSRIEIALGYLHRGFVWEQAPEGSARPLALVGHHELFNRYEVRRRARKVIASRPLDSFLDLQAGDYVVHVAHGIARFTGMQTISKDGRSEEYLTLRFADSATLHVPANRINLIQKYIGGFHGHPQLSRLGSGLWEKQKARVCDAVMDIAADLLDIQAARAAEAGVPYPPDTDWQREFEAEFPYDETPDQLTAAEDIKNDMRQPRPMDRLLCGDVGYGKTELAMRAAFKAVEYGKQVAVLVPTTVLAEQHDRSFRQRMADYPFAVESLSRFKTAGQQKQTVKRAAEGKIDILIGTHRLLSQDVRFADLGLVIVDEEQRFGVTHKERLKQMRKTVDVLTMSATPIPRTLHMSMLGLRDISSLTTAPQDRRSVVTEVMAYDNQRIKLAIERELNREGQIYFVHNRVQSIQAMAEQIQQLVPGARLLIGHGQMGEGELEKVMLAFVRHEADILVCTTIIESGLDIPNVNTIFINQADRFGLSELHQLRGRVGRWKHRAYCYLLLPPDRPVTPTAAKRLKAIEEYSHLGAGFKIAMRDLEIRGAGNILGPEQSGHIAAVGYEMYCQLLEQAVRQLKNQPQPATPDAHVEIGLSAFVPRSYIGADRQRMDVYRRVARADSLETVAQIERDITDAFGQPPRQVQVLLALTELRLLAGHFGIEKVIKREPDVVFTLRDAGRVQDALAGAPGTLRVIDQHTLYFRPPRGYLEPEALLLVLRNLLKAAHERQKASPEPPAPAPPSIAPAVAKAAEPPVRAAQPSRSKVDLSAQAEHLKKLREQGILSDEEYQSAHKRLLAKK